MDLLCCAGRWQSALELAEQCLEAAQGSQDPTHLAIAHRNMGTIIMFRGDLVPAQEHLLQGIARYGIHEHRSLALTYHQEPTSGALIWISRNLWMLDYPDQARSKLKEGVTLAQEVGHLFTLDFVMANAAVREIETRAFKYALDYNQALHDLAQDQSAPLWLNEIQLLNSICQAHTGLKTQEAIVSFTQALATRLSMGTMIFQVKLNAWLAEAHLFAGEAEDGLKAIARAMERMNEFGERDWEAELYRIKGELLLLPGGSEDEAEECFNQAFEVARSRRAKSLELRAEMSLARLWRKKGKTTDARVLLDEVYGWFNEGFETPDLIDAKALLGELS